MPDPALPQPFAPPRPALWHAADRWTGTDSWATAHPRNIRVAWGQPRTRQLALGPLRARRLEMELV